MFSWYTFSIGVILAVIPFALGFFIGKNISNRRKRSSETNSKKSVPVGQGGNSEYLQAITTRIQNMVHRVSNDVSNHQVRIEQLTRELHSMKSGSISVEEEVIRERLNQLLRTMSDFRSRLGEAESQIQVHTEQIDRLAKSQNIIVDELVKANCLDASLSDLAGIPEEHQVSDQAAESTGARNTSEVSEGCEIDESSDFDSMLANVRSRLNEIVQATDKETAEAAEKETAETAEKE